MTKQRPLIGISACLLGNRVRYDGHHKRADLIVDTLSPRVDWLPVCPEVEAGLGVPRPPVRLVRAGHEVRVIGVDDPALDVTGVLTRHAEHRVRNLSGISGFILKSRSPSCGLSSTPLRDSGELISGVFANHLQRTWPELPLAEEQQLTSVELILAFFSRVREYPVIPDPPDGLQLSKR